MRNVLGLVLLAAGAAATAAHASGTHAQSLDGAVGKTAKERTMRYVMDIAVVRKRHPETVIHVVGTKGDGQLLVHVKQLAVVLKDGARIPGPEQSAMLDGPFLYEGAPNGTAIDGHIRWLRVRLQQGRTPKTLAAMRSLSPLPLFHVLDESAAARTSTKTGKFAGTVAYDDPIVRTVLTAMTGGIEFRHLRFETNLGGDGLVHAIRVTGRTADGVLSLSVSAHLYGFGRPVHLVPPAEGTFMDEKSSILAD